MNKLSYHNKFLIKKYLILVFAVCFFASQSAPKGLSYLGTINATFYSLIFTLASYIVYVIYTFDLISIYDKNYMQFLRYKNKREYLENLLKYCSKNFNLLFAIFIAILTIFVSINFFLRGDVLFSFDLLSFFKLIYNFFKIFVLTEIFLQIGILLSKCFSKVIASIYLLLIQIISYSWVYDITTVDSFNKIHLFYGYYLKDFEYSNIFLDVFAFVLQVIIFTLILELIKYLTLKYKKVYIED